MRHVRHPWLFTAVVAGPGCVGRPEVVVYSALDREFAEPILIT
jgi:hypothetical protein